MSTQNPTAERGILFEKGNGDHIFSIKTAAEISSGKLMFEPGTLNFATPPKFISEKDPGWINIQAKESWIKFLGKGSKVEMRLDLTSYQVVLNFTKKPDGILMVAEFHEKNSPFHTDTNYKKAAGQLPPRLYDISSEISFFDIVVAFAT